MNRFCQGFLVLKLCNCNPANKGVLKTALFSPIESNSLDAVCLGRTQPHENLLLNVVSVQPQTNSGAVRLW